MLKPKAELALRAVVELTTNAELKSGEAKGGVESRTKQLGGGISWSYGAYERTVGAITCMIAFAASEATVVYHFGCVRDNCYA